MRENISLDTQEVKTETLIRKKSVSRSVSVFQGNIERNFSLIPIRSWKLLSRVIFSFDLVTSSDT